MKYRIRENVLFNARYLKRDGTWGTWKEAAKFASQDAATKFADEHIQGDTYGLFTAKIDDTPPWNAR